MLLPRSSLLPGTPTDYTQPEARAGKLTMSIRVSLTEQRQVGRMEAGPRGKAECPTQWGFKDARYGLS